jgi:hypothetical protein
MDEAMRTALLTGDLGTLLESAEPDESWTIDITNPGTGAMSGTRNYRFDNAIWGLFHDGDDNTRKVSFVRCLDAADAAASVTLAIEQATMAYGIGVKLGALPPDGLIISHRLKSDSDMGVFTDTIIPTGMDGTI